MDAQDSFNLLGARGNNSLQPVPFDPTKPIVGQPIPTPAPQTNPLNPTQNGAGPLSGTGPLDLSKPFTAPVMQTNNGGMQGGQQPAAQPDANPLTNDKLMHAIMSNPELMNKLFPAGLFPNGIFGGLGMQQLGEPQDQDAMTKLISSVLGF